MNVICDLSHYRSILILTMEKDKENCETVTVFKYFKDNICKGLFRKQTNVHVYRKHFTRSLYNDDQDSFLLTGRAGFKYLMTLFLCICTSTYIRYMCMWCGITQE